jgi:hypothetical protein
MNVFSLFKVAAYSLTLLICVVVGGATSVAQKIVNSTQAPCEENSAWLDGLMEQVNESGERERVFVIARLGLGETSRHLNRRRLANAKVYLENRLKPEDIILAEGERISGEGRVEFYVGSKLTLISLVKRGRDLCVNCFERNPKYYGCGRTDRPKKYRGR